MLLTPTFRTVRAAFFIEASFAKGEVLRILNCAIGNREGGVTPIRLKRG
jgi:hypothetical protein